jgi:hypothetical protein
MISPYSFCEVIRRARHPERKTMAELALNLYFGPEELAFDLSKLFELEDVHRLACVGAIAWACAQRHWKPGSRSYMQGEHEYLNNPLRVALRADAFLASEAKE